MKANLPHNIPYTFQLLSVIARSYVNIILFKYNTSQIPLKWGKKSFNIFP